MCVCVCTLYLVNFAHIDSVLGKQFPLKHSLIFERWCSITSHYIGVLYGTSIGIGCPNNGAHTDMHTYIGTSLLTLHELKLISAHPIQMCVVLLQLNP